MKYEPGTLSAKGFDAAGKVIAETKVETTGDADADSTHARSQDHQRRRRGRGGVHRFRARRARPRCAGGAEQNQFRHRRRGQNHRRGQRRSELPRAGHVRSDRARAQHRRRRLALEACKTFRRTAASVPEYANDFDDSAWSTLDGKTGGGASTIETPEHHGDLPRAFHADGRRPERRRARRFASPAATTRAGIS